LILYTKKQDVSHLGNLYSVSSVFLTPRILFLLQLHLYRHDKQWALSSVKEHPCT
jgi:hypothetical protein